MKKTIAILLVIFIANFVSAQENDEYQTVFKNSKGETNISGFGTVNLDFGSINGNFALIMGGDAAILFNRSFYIGLYGRGLTTMPTYYSRRNGLYGIKNYSEQASFGHGGFLFGYIFSPTKPVHFGFSGKVGMGGIVLYDRDIYDRYQPGFDYLSTGPFYVFTPQVDLEMNMANWFKIKLSAGYQFVTKNSLTYFTVENEKKEILNSNDFSTPTISLGFVFGWFK